MSSCVISRISWCTRCASTSTNSPAASLNSGIPATWSRRTGLPVRSYMGHQKCLLVKDSTHSIKSQNSRPSWIQADAEQVTPVIGSNALCYGWMLLSLQEMSPRSTWIVCCCVRLLLASWGRDSTSLASGLWTKCRSYITWREDAYSALISFYKSCLPTSLLKSFAYISVDWRIASELLIKWK